MRFQNLSKVLYEQGKYSFASIYLKKAKAHFLSGNVLKDVYNELPFEIYIEDIDEMSLKNEKAKNNLLQRYDHKAINKMPAIADSRLTKEQ